MLHTTLVCIVGSALTLLIFLTSGLPAQKPQPLYKDPAQPVEKRIDDLVGRMTLDENASQLVNHTRITIGSGQPGGQSPGITAKFAIQGDRQLPR